MPGQHDPVQRQLVTYELSAEFFDLNEGDIIIPGQEIGIDIRSGCAVYPDSRGRVDAISYNQMNDSYRVLIHSLSRSGPGWRVPPEKTHVPGKLAIQT